MPPSPLPRLPIFPPLLPFINRALEPNRPHSQLPVRPGYPPEVAPGEVGEHRAPLQPQALAERSGVKHVVTIGNRDPVYIRLLNHDVQHTEIMYQGAEKVNNLLTNTEIIDTLWLSDKEMAPAVLVASRSPAHKELAYGHHQCSVRALCRIEDDSSLTPVSEHQDIVDAVVAGKQKLEVEDFDFSYGVYANGRRVICFAEGRVSFHPPGALGPLGDDADRVEHEDGVVCDVLD